MSVHDMNANGAVLTAGLCAMLRQQLAPEVGWLAGRKHESEYLAFPKIQVCDAVPPNEVWMVDETGKTVAKLTNIGEPYVRRNAKPL